MNSDGTPAGVKQKWLNFVLHFSGYISSLKNKLTDAGGFKTIVLAIGILVLEAVNFIISLPAYFFISPALGSGQDDAVRVYKLRRIVSLSLVAAIICAWLIKIGIVALVGVGIFSHGERAKADTVSWDFNNPVAYLYDSSKIQIVDGMAIFKASPTSLLNTAAASIADTESEISLPPTSGTVSASADLTTNTTVSNTDSSQTTVTSSVNPDTDAPPVETSPLAPVVETMETVVTTPTPEPTPAPVIAPEPTPAPPPIEAPPCALSHSATKRWRSIAVFRAKYCPRPIPDLFRHNSTAGAVNAFKFTKLEWFFRRG